MSKSQMESPRVVSQSEWLAARKELLKKEKELTHLRDALSAERRKLPWVKVEKEYVFDTPAGKKKLAELQKETDAKIEKIAYPPMVVATRDNLDAPEVKKALYVDACPK